MFVIGTAGHVDHGKSSLVSALTGTHPDRLKEEKEREMTIELGFAWFNMPDGQEVGIIDVPGHRDFIENMLAGVGGIDAALFVVAADEGIMPQTREHLAILDLLKVQGGVIALTKSDLIDDPEWMGLIIEDIRSTMADSVFRDARIIPVSSKTGTGLTELKQELSRYLQNLPRKNWSGKPRLPIDRVFSMSGFGTVVTGTLLNGPLDVGEEIVILPGEIKGRIRGLQSHKHKVDQAIPGSRSAVNISGIEAGSISRGDILTVPGGYTPTRRLDCQIQLLEAEKSIHHNDSVKFFLGTSEATARIRLLGSDELKPGKTGWAQLEFVDPIVAARSDRFILRWPSPAATIGGGVVLNSKPDKRYKRFDQSIMVNLETILRGNPGDVLYDRIKSFGPYTINEITNQQKEPSSDLHNTLNMLVDEGKILLLQQGDQTFYISKEEWNFHTSKIVRWMEDYYRTNPLKKAISKEEIRSKLRLDSKKASQLLSLLSQAGVITSTANLISLPGYEVQLNLANKKKVLLLMEEFRNQPSSPPSVKEAIDITGTDLYQYLVESDTLVQLNEEVVYLKEDHEKILLKTRQWLLEQGKITVAEYRDKFQTSRKYALAFLEYMDAQGITVRQGDYRILK